MPCGRSLSCLSDWVCCCCCRGCCCCWICLSFAVVLLGVVMTNKMLTCKTFAQDKTKCQKPTTRFWLWPTRCSFGGTKRQTDGESVSQFQFSSVLCICWCLVFGQKINGQLVAVLWLRFPPLAVSCCSWTCCMIHWLELRAELCQFFDLRGACFLSVATLQRFLTAPETESQTKIPLERNSNFDSRPTHKQSVWLSPFFHFVFVFLFSCVYAYQLNSLNL